MKNKIIKRSESLLLLDTAIPLLSAGSTFIPSHRRGKLRAKRVICPKSHAEHLRSKVESKPLYHMVSNDTVFKDHNKQGIKPDTQLGLSCAYAFEPQR